jgi:phage terminase large subunit-like protein
MKRSERNAQWIEAHCHVPEGRLVGQPVKLHPVQREILAGIYDSPTRRAIISFGRKNTKTTLSAMLVLLHLAGPEAIQNAQLFSAAQSRDQAAILFGLGAKMVRMSPDLSAYVTIRDSGKQLHCPELGTLYRALSAEVSTSFGLSPAFVVHDELGQVRGPRSDLYEALETAAGAQESPLSIVISTQAPDDADLLSVLIDDAAKGEDPTTKLFLWTAPIEADPFVEKTWKLANPMYGDVLNPEVVREQAEAARRMPSREASFRNLVLNQRVNQSSPFVPRGVWMKCGDEPEPEALGGAVFAGLDLSARNDLTALAYVAQDADRCWHCWVEFFAPELGLIDRARRDRAPYDVWAREGWITLTPGASVDLEVPAKRLLELCDDHDVRVAAFDRWRIDVFTKELARHLGVDVTASDMAKRVTEAVPLRGHGQGFRDMSPALDVMEAALLNGKLRHGGNPVLTWCAANARTSRDPAGNRKLDKSKTTGRIDGMQALAMAFGASGMVEEMKQGPSVYEARGVLEV